MADRATWRTDVAQWDHTTSLSNRTESSDHDHLARKDSAATPCPLQNTRLPTPRLAQKRAPAPRTGSSWAAGVLGRLPREHPVGNLTTGTKLVSHRQHDPGSGERIIPAVIVFRSRRWGIVRVLSA